MLLGSTMAFSPSAHSQTANQPNGQGKGQHEMDFAKLKTDLSLTDAQVSSWKSLEEQYKPKFKALKSDSSITEEVKKVKMKELHSAKKADLKKILSEEQFAKFTDIKRQQKGKH